MFNVQCSMFNVLRLMSSYLFVALFGCSTFRFNCDWKRRLLATSFTAFCEMVVTNRVTHDVQPILGNQSFDQRDAFYDRVDYFRDPDFWADYNIIEPTETLNQAIGKLLKKYKN